MSRWPDTGRSSVMSFPRVSGDEPTPAKRAADTRTFSPRERG